MRNYDKEFKKEAVKLSQEIGNKKASEQLGISYHTLIDWKRKFVQHGELAYVGSGHSYKDPNKSTRETELEKENNELRKANEILKDALYFFAKDRKK